MNLTNRHKAIIWWDHIGADERANIVSEFSLSDKGSAQPLINPDRGINTLTGRELEALWDWFTSWDWMPK